MAEMKKGCWRGGEILKIDIFEDDRMFVCSVCMMRWRV